MKSRQLTAIVSAAREAMTQARKDNPEASHACGRFTFSHYQVTFFMYRDGSNEVEVYNKKRETFLDNVARYIETRTPCYDDVDDKRITVWEANGFLDEADYNRYRFAV